MNSQPRQLRAADLSGLDYARSLFKEGRIEEAESAYARILDQTPDQVEALNAVAMGAFRRGQYRHCLSLLEQALRAQPDDAATFLNLGLTHQALDNLEAALDAFGRALSCRPEFDAARLHRADILERLGRSHEALLTYFRAITAAQSQGRWLNPASTPVGLRPLVEHAIPYVDQGRKNFFAGVIAPLRERYGQAALTRVEQCLRVYLGDQAPDYRDPRQRPTFLFFPGLPARPYYERERFAWMEAFEAQTPLIREELLRVLPGEQGREAVFDTEKLALENLRGEHGAPRWDGYYFYRHGVRNDVNCRNCPHTLSALEALPLARVRDHAPEVLFSVFAPGTHLLPHRGVTNTRLVAHLPLIVPEDCALKVGGELHVWREGRCVVFDDTYEHEAWNRSPRTRVVLILDIWHPDLTEAERAAVGDLVAAIGDFRSESEKL